MERIREDVIQYIWKQKLFDTHQLQTTRGEPVEIIRTGLFNRNSGPDFLEARIKIGKEIWAGHVEIHILASDWHRHGHQDDKAYLNVILHVVWNADAEIEIGGTALPAVELKNRVTPDLIHSIAAITESPETIPCHAHLPSLPPITYINCLENTLTERLQQKTKQFEAVLYKLRGDWEETFYRFAMRAFGMKVNSEAFQVLSESLPYNLLRKHRDKISETEAMLFGVAGLLENKGDDEYQEKLKALFAWQKLKFRIRPMNATQWKFARTRPDNFPTLRIAQFAALVHRHERLFDLFSQAVDPAEIPKMLEVQVSEYWLSHHRFGIKGKIKSGKTGESLAAGIIINAIVPALFAYGRNTGNPVYKEKAVFLLEITPPENNRVIRLWKKSGLKPSCAFETQGLLELYNNYCTHRKCLSCQIGSEILGKPAVKSPNFS